MDKLIGLRVRHKQTGVSGVIIMYNQTYNPLTRHTTYAAVVRTDHGDRIAQVSSLVRVR